jgi:hypothetical protein
MADVVRFGRTYVAQRPECSAHVEAIVAEAQGRRFRTLGGATSYTTRRLREAGLKVATPVDRALRRTRPAFHWNDDGGEAA